MIFHGGHRTAGTLQARIGIFFVVAFLLFALIHLLDLEDKFPFLSRLGQDTESTDETKSTKPKAEAGEARNGGDAEGEPSTRDAPTDESDSAAASKETGEGETTSSAPEPDSDGSPANGEKTTNGPKSEPAELPQQVKALQAEAKAQREALRQTRETLRQQWKMLHDMLANQRETLANIQAEQERLSELPRELAEMDDRLRAMERRVYEHRDTIARLQRQVRRPDRLDMSDPVVMHPRNLYRNSPLRLFDGQVMVHLTGFSETEDIYYLEKGRRREAAPRLLRKNPSLQPTTRASDGDGRRRDSEPHYRRRKGADFEITVPLLDILVFKGVQVGDRRVFSYLQRDFFLEVLGTDEDTYARVAITRKLPE